MTGVEQILKVVETNGVDREFLLLGLGVHGTDKEQNTNQS